MEENQSELVQQEAVVQTSQKGIKIALIVLGILLLFTVSAYAVWNCFPEWVLSPKNMYLMTENNSMKGFQKQLDNYFNDAFVKDYLKVYTTPYESQSDITMKLDTDKLQVGNMNQMSIVKKMLENTKISITQAADIKNEKENSKASLVVNGSKLFDLNVFVNKNQAGISIPELYNKYITFDTSDMATVSKNLGMESGLKKIVTYNDLMKVIKIDKKEVSDIQKDYTKFFVNSLSKDDVKFTKNAEIATEDGNIKCRELTVTLTSARLKDISAKLYDKVSNDEKLLNLMANNVVNVVKLYDDAGYFESDKTAVPDEFKSVDAFKKAIKENLNNAKNNLPDATEDNAIVINLYIDKDYNVLQREFKVSEGGKIAESSGTVKIGSYKNPKTGGYNSIFEIDGGEGKLTFSKVDAKKESKKPETSAIKFAFVNNSNSTQGFEGNINLSVDSKDNKTKDITADFNLNTNASAAGKIYGTITENISRDTNNLNTDTTFSLNVNAPMEGAQSGQEFGASFNVKNAIKFNVPVTIPSINSSNSLNLNTATASEIREAYMEIQNAAMQFVQKNQSLLSGN